MESKRKIHVHYSNTWPETMMARKELCVGMAYLPKDSSETFLPSSPGCLQGNYDKYHRNTIRETLENCIRKPLEQRLIFRSNNKKF